MSTLLNVTYKNLRSEEYQDEQCVLGSILLKQEKMDDVISVIDENDFQIHAHRLIWRGIKFLYNKNKEIDEVSLITLLNQFNKLDDVGGSDYLARLIGSVPSAENAGFYAEMVRSKSIRRQAYKTVHNMLQFIESNDIADDEEFLSNLENEISKLRPETLSTMRHAGEGEDEYFAYLEEKEDFIHTGFKEFDEWMGGIGRGWLYILAGRPSVGKTAKMLQMAQGVARSEAGPVLIWSQEMATNPLKNRIMSNMAEVPAAGFRKKNLEPKEKQRIREAYHDLKKLPIHIEDSKGVTIDQVRATSRQFKRKHNKIGAIIVDYLTIMKINQASGQRWDQAIGYVTRNAKLLAMELDCPFIMLAQLNREGDEKRPTLRNLKDSGDIEQDADVVEFLWKNPDDRERNDGVVIESVIAKGRDIGVNDFKFLFKPWFQRYEELR